MARRLLGGIGRGVLGRSLGGLAGGVGGAAAGIALTFATTYALGHAATRYYGQDRNLSREDLRDLFDRLKDEASTIFPRVEERIRERARSLDLSQVLARIRGGLSPT